MTVTALPPVVVQQAGSTTVEVEVDHIQVEVGTTLNQQNLWVGTVQPAFSAPGIWIETGLGANGEDFTFWIEDGT